MLTTLVFKGILTVCTSGETTNLSPLHAILLEALRNESSILFASRVFKLLGTVCSQPGVGLSSTFRLFIVADPNPS